MFRKSILVISILALVFAAHVAAAGPLTPIQELGQKLFMDQNLSANANQSCASCHHPSAAFADPDNVAKPNRFPVSDGSFTDKFGGRNAPTAAYAAFIPKLHWDGELFIGGMFWDGRASGLKTAATAGIGAGPTYDPLADQAKGPFLNPVEMAMVDEMAVVQKVRAADYAPLYEKVFPGVLYKDSKVLIAYNNIAKAISAFEKSVALNKFNSKFDNFVAEQGGDVGSFGIEVVTDLQGNAFRKYVGVPAGFRSNYFTRAEAEGLALFNADSETQLGVMVSGGTQAGGMCYLCHITERHDATAYGKNSVMPANPLSQDGTYPPALTDYSYDNLGMPKNPRIEELGGPTATDYGLGDSSRVPELQSLYKPLLIDPGTGIATDEQGKFKVSSLRNIAKTAPYGHNGYFATLKEIVHFYNTRDVAPQGTFEAPEVPETVNGSELGKLGLSSEQEDKIVLFLKTLSDN